MVLIVGAAVSWLMVRLAMTLALREGMLDMPGDRQSHTRPTPTGGGAGIIFTILAGSLLLVTLVTVSADWLKAILPGLALLSVLGWLDDQRSLSAVLRLLVQLSVSFGLLIFLGVTGQSGGWLILILGGLAIAWVMNFFNFMDGSHGMAGFQGLFCGLVLAIVFFHEGRLELGFPALLLAGCCLGFLPLNFPAPKVFMGDAGSVPLGFAIAGLMTLGYLAGALPLPVSVLLLSVFLVDSSLTLFKRVIRGERWYTAHKQHLYQRLIGQRWSHSRVLLLYQSLNLLVVAPAAVLALMYPEYAWLLAAAVLLLLATGWQIASLNIGVRNER